MWELLGHASLRLLFQGLLSLSLWINLEGWRPLGVIPGEDRPLTPPCVPHCVHTSVSPAPTPPPRLRLGRSPLAQAPVLSHLSSPDASRLRIPAAPHGSLRDSLHLPGMLVLTASVSSPEVTTWSGPAWFCLQGMFCCLDMFPSGLSKESRGV